MQSSKCKEHKYCFSLNNYNLHIVSYYITFYYDVHLCFNPVYMSATLQINSNPQNQG